MLKGHIYEQTKSKKWVLKYYRTPQILVVLPVHPDDAKHLTKNDHIKEVSFQIETIAMGTSEFDIRDCDVARIIIKPNLYSSIENAERFDEVATELEMMWMHGAKASGHSVDTVGVPTYETID